jgi:hypothetical protein
VAVHNARQASILAAEYMTAQKSTNREENMKKGWTLGLAAVFAAVTLSPAVAAQCTNDVFKKVMSSGKISIGVKADYKPWGFRSENGDLVGMEIDMAQDVADTMGVELELVAVQSSNRMQFLEQGKIDMMIATMSDRADRRKLVGIVQPNYYTSGTNVLAPKGVGLKDWSELKDKPVCGKQGAFYNKIVEERYGAKVVARLGLRRQLHHVGPRLGQLGRLRDAAGLRGRQSLGPGRASGRKKLRLRSNDVGSQLRLAAVRAPDRAGEEVGHPADRIPGQRKRAPEGLARRVSSGPYQALKPSRTGGTVPPVLGFFHRRGVGDAG